jgi:hypothetical protein
MLAKKDIPAWMQASIWNVFLQAHGSLLRALSL